MEDEAPEEHDLARNGPNSGTLPQVTRPGRRRRGGRSIAAVVARGGRPDLAGPALSQVRAPTLLVVGGGDFEVLALNRQAQRQLRCKSRLEIVPGATHLFEEPGSLERVVELARAWFVDHLPREGESHVVR